MAWRAIQDTVGASESLGGLSHLAERLYWRLLAHSDPYGRHVCSPRKLRAKCYPLVEVNDHDAGLALLELERADRIRVYRPASDWVLQLVDFEKNQPREAYRKRPDPGLPEPPNDPTEDGILAAFGSVIHSSGDFPETFRNTSGHLPETPASEHFPETFRNSSGNLPAQTRRDETETETETGSSSSESFSKNHPLPEARPEARANGTTNYLLPERSPADDALEPVSTFAAAALAQAAGLTPTEQGEEDIPF